MAEYTISELENLSGVARRNIHFYVQQGVLPPPEGAGLGARYAEEHLMRLRAIPVLRDRGLRLDEIRDRLRGLDSGDLQALLAPPPGPLPPVRQPPVQAPPYGRSVTRYTLAPGVELLVEQLPETSGGVDAARIAELLREAQRIFQPYIRPYSTVNSNGGNR